MIVQFEIMRVKHTVKEIRYNVYAYFSEAIVVVLLFEN